MQLGCYLRRVGRSNIEGSAAQSGERSACQRDMSSREPKHLERVEGAGALRRKGEGQKGRAVGVAFSCSFSVAEES